MRKIVIFPLFVLAHLVISVSLFLPFVILATLGNRQSLMTVQFACIILFGFYD